MVRLNRTKLNRPEYWTIREDDRMLLEGEKKNVEYKLEYTKTFLKTVCAYANFHDGIIIFGIKDEGTVVGVDHIDDLKHNIENAINDSILPKPYYELLVATYEGVNVVVVKVYKGDYTIHIST